MLHKLFRFLFQKRILIILWTLIIAYIVYFSYFTILRFHTLYASYFDLGIMHQTVYNTFQAIKTHDWSRFLEMTDIDGSSQIKRMAIHNDLLLAPISLFYFIYSGPQTLLILQTIILALGALAVFKISQKILGKYQNSNIISLIFATSYLLFPALERANFFDFHAVTLATSFLLWMFYFYLNDKLLLSFIFFLLSLLTKEEVGLTTAFFGLYTLTDLLKPSLKLKKNKAINLKAKNYFFSFSVILISIFWFILSVSYIIPYFRGSHHFALKYYGDFGDSPTQILIGLIKNPLSIEKYLFRIDTFTYFLFLLGPLGFLSLLSPIQLLIALPEFAINLLSTNWNMRNIIYHYTSVITPFVFISSIYGVKNVYLLIKNKTIKQKMFLSNSLIAILLIFTLIFAYLKGPLPFAKEAETHPFKFPQVESKDVLFWSNLLKNDNLKISATGQLAPFFTGRRYFYIFSQNYQEADYVLVRLNEIYDYPERNDLIPVYNKLEKDYNYKLIYKRNKLEVYKKI